jgi:HPt (histidine-containing phosphotransfer) domain-containing protein
MQDAAAPDTAAPDAAAPDASNGVFVLDVNIIREQIGEDLELLGDLVQTYRSQREEILASLRDGVARNDTAQVASQAHKLKGSLLTLGGGRAVVVARRIERMGRDGDISECDGALADLEREIAHLDGAHDRLLSDGFGAALA